MLCCVPARVGVVRISSSAKAHVGIARLTIILVIAYDSNPCFGPSVAIRRCVETFPVAVGLKGGTRYQRPPRVTAQGCTAVLSVGDERVKGSGLLVNRNKFGLTSYLHAETDSGERCAPVSW